MHRDITHEFISLKDNEELRAAREYSERRYPYLKTDLAKLEIFREDAAWRRFYEIDRKYRYATGEIQKCNP